MLKGGELQEWEEYFDEVNRGSQGKQVGNEKDKEREETDRDRNFKERRRGTGESLPVALCSRGERKKRKNVLQK